MQSEFFNKPVGAVQCYALKERSGNWFDQFRKELQLLATSTKALLQSTFRLYFVFAF